MIDSEKKTKSVGSGRGTNQMFSESNWFGLVYYHRNNVLSCKSAGLLKCGRTTFVEFEALIPIFLCSSL